MPPTDPTADYRQYPKQPSFGLVVALAALALLVVLGLGLLVLHMGAAKKADPIKQQQHPEPNSRLKLPLPAAPPTLA